MMRRREVVAGLVMLGLGACHKKSANEVVVYCSVDQVFAEPILRAFESASGIKVQAVFDTEETKSTGVLNRIIAEAPNPRCDVFWSGDPVRPFALIKRGLVERYASPGAADLPEAMRAKDGAWTGTGARARVLLLNKNRCPDARPASVRDLAAPAWKGRAALANPLFGTTTMHVAALATAWGDDKIEAFLDEVKKNGARIAASNGEVKRLVVAGEVAFGLCDTDDAAEAIKDGAPVEVVYPDQDALGMLVMPSSVVRVRGPHESAAHRLIDALVAADTERRLAETGGYVPLRASVAAPEHAPRVSDRRAMKVDYADVAAAMERLQPWLKQWAGL